ncbi:MFS transporter [Paractinoplanes maris]|uniref:MFS transporter n=1 Tax=Paractinoplanes maris TaxID=1734446 RepID=UPI00202151D0|nr:MFS transporter [Actinoplanes maris]
MPNSGFRRFWAGQTASQLGEHTSLVILPLLAVLTLDVGASQLGLLRAVGQAPLLLLALLAGAWVDRWQPRTVMVLADLGRALALGVAGVAALIGGLGLPALLVISFAVGSLSVLFDVAYQSFLVRLVDRDHLLRATSAVEGSRSAAQMAGPALGGFLVSALSAPLAATSAAGVFVVSALSLVRIRQRFASTSGPRRIRDGVAFVIRHPVLRPICFASAAFNFFFAATMTVYLLFLPRALGLSAAGIGLALAATGPGALVGSLLAVRLPRRTGYGPAIVGAALISDGVLLLAPALHGGSASTVTALITINLVFGVFGQLVNVAVMTVRQSVTPHPLQGRVAATITFAGMGLTPVGSLLGGILADRWGLRLALVVMASGMLLSPILMALSPVARLGRRLDGNGMHMRFSDSRFRSGSNEA